MVSIPRALARIAQTPCARHFSFPSSLQGPSRFGSCWSNARLMTEGTKLHQGSEFVIAVVAPVGVSVSGLVEKTEAYLKTALDYGVRTCRLSKLITSYTGSCTQWPDEYTRINNLIDLGNSTRKQCGNDSVARMAIADIRSARPVRIKGGKDHQVTDVLPFSRTVHLLLSLK